MAPRSPRQQRQRRRRAAACCRGVSEQQRRGADARGELFFELGAGASMVKLLPVIAGVSFSDDEIPGKVRRLLTYGGNVLCKVVEVAGSGDMASAAGDRTASTFNVNLGGE